MRTIKKNGNLVRLLPLEGDKCCPNCRFQFDPVKFRRALYVACQHITCLECVIRSKRGCDQCNDNQSGGSVFALPIVKDHNQEKEKRELPKLVENGTSPAANLSPKLAISPPKQAISSPKPAILSLMKKPVVAEVQPTKQAEKEEEDVDKLEPNKDIDMMEEHCKEVRNKGNAIDSSPPHKLLVNVIGSDCDVVFIKRKAENTQCCRETCKQCPFTCSTCQWQFDTENDLLCHRLMHTGAQCQPEIIDMTYTNGVGGSPLGMQTNRILELKANSPRRVSPRRLENGSDSPSKTVALPLVSGTIQEVYPCPHCNKILSTKLFLNCHLSLSHGRLRPHYCDRCVSSFQSLEELQDHRRTIHPHADRRYKCTKCESKYSQKYRLEQHLRLMHSTTTTSGSATSSAVSSNIVLLSPRRARLRKNRILKETKKLDISKREFKCDICSRSFYHRSHKISHMLNKHRIRLKLTADDLANREAKGEEGKYCPECQSEFDKDLQGEHRMVAFSMCGHLCCLECSIRDADLGCGQCTTETAPKTRFPSASPSPVKKLMKMEIVERRKSQRMVVKPLKLRDLLDLREVDEIIDNEEKLNLDQDGTRLRTKRCHDNASEEQPPRRGRGRPKGSTKLFKKLKIAQRNEAVSPKTEEVAGLESQGDGEPPRRRRGRPRKIFKKLIKLCENRRVSARAKLEKRQATTLPLESKKVAARANTPAVNKRSGLNNKQWNCRYCDASYGQKRLLCVHIQKKHRDILPVHCHICQWSFHSRRDRDRHSLRKHGVSGRRSPPLEKSDEQQKQPQQQYKCKNCEATYKGLRGLKRHTMLAHPSKRRGPYKKKNLQE